MGGVAKFVIPVYNLLNGQFSRNRPDIPERLPASGVRVRVRVRVLVSDT